MGQIIFKDHNNGFLLRSCFNIDTGKTRDSNNIMQTISN